MALAAAIRKIEKDKNTTYAKIIIGDGDKWDFPARTARLTGQTRTVAKRGESMKPFSDISH